jgi:hypothetical protein
MFNKFKRSYEIQTSKSFDEILTDLNNRAEKQTKNKALLLWEPVNYRKFKIQDNKIEIERLPNPFNPFKGNGIITYEFQSNETGTHIKCTIDPILFQIWFGFGFFALILTLFIIIAVLTSNYLFILFITLFGVLAFGFSYLLVSFNSSNLESYSKTILYDLNLISNEIK